MQHETQKSNLTFYVGGQSVSGKTNVYEVWSHDKKVFMGSIQWSGKEKSYVYEKYPLHAHAITIDERRDIDQYIKKLMAEKRRMINLLKR